MHVNSDENDGYKYLLVVIDIFSHYAWIEPIKDKTAREIVRAFNKIIIQGRKPHRLTTDAAKDFTSKVFQEYLKSKDMHTLLCIVKNKKNYVEQFIKTIKSRIWGHIRAQNSRRYIDVLQKLVDSYNKSWHTGILSEPINVNKENENRLWWQMYWPKDLRIKKESKNKKVKFLFKLVIKLE